MSPDEFKRETLRRFDNLDEAVSAVSRKIDTHEERADADRRRIFKLEGRLNAQSSRIDRTAGEIARVRTSILKMGLLVFSGSLGASFVGAKIWQPSEAERQSEIRGVIIQYLDARYSQMRETGP